MKADLHCHSYFSDGELSVEEVVALGKKAGAQLMSLTDHDTMFGTDRARAAAKKEGIAFVSGVEISTHDKCDVHILGYNVDKDNPLFVKFEQEMAVSKQERVQSMIDKLAAFGMSISLDDVRQFAQKSLSRAHVAKALVAKGYEPDVQSCFNKWLREGAPCYAANEYMLPQQGVELINKCSGVAVLAHPVRLKLTQSDVSALVRSLADCGLKGIEASYKFSGEEAVRLYSRLAKETGLIVTNGGDFHTLSRNVIIPREMSEQALEVLGVKDRV